MGNEGKEEGGAEGGLGGDRPGSRQVNAHAFVKTLAIYPLVSPRRDEDKSLFELFENLRANAEFLGHFS